jgi:hypothetical protein
MSNADNALETIAQYAESVKDQLLRPSKGILRHPYLGAGIGDTYPDLTDWDAVWAGIGYVKRGDTEPLRTSLLNLIEHIAPDGKGQRRIGFKQYSAPPYQCRPFLASGACVLSELIGTDWLDDAGCDSLHNHLLWWHSNRTGREGLLKWLHVDEGFADNGLANWAWEGNAVQGVDLNAQLVREHMGLARVFDMRGDDTRASIHRDYAGRLCHRIETCLWHEETGSYASLYNPPNRHDASVPITVLAYNSLWPLWVGISSPERAKTVIERHILNDEDFRTPYGIRSMAKSERHYNNMKDGYINPMAGSPQFGAVEYTTCSNWQGPVWAPSTYCAVFALKRYGYTDEAWRIAEDFVAFLAMAVERDGGYYENYDAETGEGLVQLGIGSWYMMMDRLLDDQDVFPGV